VHVAPSDDAHQAVGTGVQAQFSREGEKSGGCACQQRLHAVVRVYFLLKIGLLVSSVATAYQFSLHWPPYGLPLLLQAFDLQVFDSIVCLLRCWGPPVVEPTICREVSALALGQHSTPCVGCVLAVAVL
jgi:hypothetical protein